MRETKIVPTYRVSNNCNIETTTAFISDLASRLNNRVQLLTEAMNSYPERLNWRSVDAGSKKLENFEAAVALNFASHNLVKSHSPLKMTPAMAAGVERKFWSYAIWSRQQANGLHRRTNKRVHKLHGCYATYLETVPVTGRFQDQTVWAFWGTNI